MASFFVIQGLDQGHRFELTGETILIGRDPTNQFQLRDGEVSRRHAKVVWNGSLYVLSDLDSANGVLVNGRKTKERILINGDRILLGKTLMLFAASHTEAPSASQKLIRNVIVRQDERGEDQSRIIQAIASDAAVPLSDLRQLSDDANWAEPVNAHLRMMYHTTLVVSQTLDIGVLLHRILDLIFEWVNVDRGSILLFDSETNRLLPKATRFSPKASAGEESSRMEIGKSIIDYVLKRREGVLTADAQNDERWSINEHSVREVICVPMQGRYGLVGLIYIDTLRLREGNTDLGKSPSDIIPPRLTGEHLRLMVAVAHQAALAVEDTRYYMGMVQSERLAAIGQTVTTLSHHIKNILQGIRGGSHLIEMGLAGHDETLVDKGWRIVEKNQTRISHLILDMLTFSKEREPALTFGDIRETLDDVLELMKGQADEVGVKLLFRQQIEVPMFFFDAEQIHRAITNIVLNAIEAVREPTRTEEEVDFESETSFQNVPAEKVEGTVQVRLDFDEKRSMVLIFVDDNGPGILPNHRDQLFRPFRSDRKGRGTGLGIPVAYKIFKEHGGTVNIEDSPVGGARFVLELPSNIEEQRELFSDPAQ